MGVRGSKIMGISTGSVTVRLLSSSSSSSSSIMTPKGYIPVSVGVNEENKRFMVHRTALGDAEFMEFLCRSAEEYGFVNEGILKIPYETKVFEQWMIKRAKHRMIRVKSF